MVTEEENEAYRDEYATKEHMNQLSTKSTIQKKDLLTDDASLALTV